MKTSRLASPANSGGASHRRHPTGEIPTEVLFPSTLGTIWRFLIAALAYCAIALAASVIAATVSWDPNAEPDIANYRVRYGTSPGIHSEFIDAGTNTSVRVDGLREGETYYFVVIAVNEAGVQSQPSVEVSYSVPVTSPSNQSPIANSHSLSTAEDAPVAVSLTATDPDSDPLTYSVVNGPTKGRLSGTPPNVTYTPNPDYNGADSFTFRASDGSLFSNTAKVTINISAVNDAPVAASTSASVTQGNSVGVTLSATDKEGHSLAYLIVGGPSNGVLAGSGANLTYTPNAGYSGPDAFTFQASDGSTTSNTGTITITVKPANTIEWIARTKWTLRSVDSEETPNFTASRAFDGNPGTFWHTRFTSGSTAHPHEIQIDLGETIEVHGFRYLPRQDSNLVGNIADYEFHTSSDGIHWGSPAATGTFAKNSAEKEVSFSARNARYIKLTALSEVNGYAHANVAELNLLGAVVSNNPPAAASQEHDTLVKKPVSFKLAGSDIDGDYLTYSIVSKPTHGKLTGSAPSMTYIPSPGFSGTDSFTYEVHDGAVASGTASVKINVSGGGDTNHTPVFAKDVIRCATALGGQAYKGESIAKLASDRDKGDVLRFSKESGPAWLEISPQGRLSGKPPESAEGIHRFSVRATDPSGAFAEANLVIEVISINLPLPWEFEQIGGPDRKGDATKKAGTLKLTGTGDLAGDSDAATFIWQTLSGDGQIVARVSALQNAGKKSLAGLMIRNSLAPNSKQVFFGVNGAEDLRWVRRTHTGKPTTTKDVGGGKNPNAWLALVRRGDTIIAYTSDDGSDWERVTAATVEFNSHCHIGLVVSGGKGRNSTATFRDVAVRP